MKVLESYSIGNLDHNPLEETPYFPADIWPLILENGSSLSKVIIILDNHFYLKKNRLKRLYKKFKIDNDVIIIEIANALNQVQKRALEELSFYGGHINVLYKTENLVFVIELMMKWIKPPALNDIDNLGLSDKWLTSFSKIYDKLNENELLFGFGHDGEPMIIFSNENKLIKIKTIIENKMNEKIKRS